MYEGRRTPVKQLIKRLGLLAYDRHAEFIADVPLPGRVVLPLSQHVGAPAVPLVKAGQHVSEGECVAEIREGALGARIHASVDGTVRAVGETIEIERG
jgi:Na+-translocating ferredoxin:NAD+ oxidoreductase RnfC subunit